MQKQLERLLDGNQYLLKLAKEAYRSYVHAYATHSLKDSFNVAQLDLARVAKGFGFAEPPNVQIELVIGKGTKTHKAGGRPSTGGAGDGARDFQKFGGDGGKGGVYPSGLFGAHRTDTHPGKKRKRNTHSAANPYGNH